MPDPATSDREMRLETFAHTVIALTEPQADDDGKPAEEFITDARARTTLHKLARLALSGTPAGPTGTVRATPYAREGTD